MKRHAIITLLFLFLAFCCFAEGPEYTEVDLMNYLTNYPDSTMPEPGKKIRIRDGFFSIEYSAIDGPGMDYIVQFSGAHGSTYLYSRKLYIYSEKMQTRKLWIEGDEVINATPITIYYTGQTAPAINEDGNRIELPVFIAEEL